MRESRPDALDGPSASSGPKRAALSLIARIVVTPKPVVNDPQGITVKQGLAALGFRDVSDVRVGKYIEVSLEAKSEHEARQLVESMCKQLLANHVIEDFRFEIETDGHRRQ